MLYGRGIVVRIPTGYNLARYRKDKKQLIRFSKAIRKLHSSFALAQSYCDLIRTHYSTNP